MASLIQRYDDRIAGILVLLRPGRDHRDASHGLLCRRDDTFPLRVWHPHLRLSGLRVNVA
jgi:hypothetical protein